MIWNHELEDGSGTPATAFGKYLVNINGRGLQIRQASDGKVLQELPELRLDDYNRVVVVEGMILALSRNTILVFSPQTTNVDETTAFPFHWQILGNPVHEKITLEIQSENPEEIDYRVVGIDGKTTAVSGRIFTHEKSRVAIELSGLPAGNYIMQLIHEGRTDQKIFMVTENP